MTKRYMKAGKSTSGISRPSCCLISLKFRWHTNWFVNHIICKGEPDPSYISEAIKESRIMDPLRRQHDSFCVHCIEFEKTDIVPRQRRRKCKLILEICNGIPKCLCMADIGLNSTKSIVYIINVRIKLINVALLYRFVLFTIVFEFISIDNHICVHA